MDEESVELINGHDFVYSEAFDRGYLDDDYWMRCRICGVSVVSFNQHDTIHRAVNLMNCQELIIRSVTDI